MEPHLNERLYEATQRKYYGRTVMAYMLHLRNSITRKDLITNIAVAYGQPEELVKSGVNKSLRLGVEMGFFVKNGNSYSVPTGQSGSQRAVRGTD